MNGKSLSIGPGLAGPAAARTGRPDSQDALRHLLKQQHAVITRSQALACGLSQEMLRSRIRLGGRWQRLLPGVYLTVTGTPTQDQRDVAAVLYAGAGSLLTGEAALRRHAVRGARSSTVDVLIPAGRQRQNVDYVRVHRTAKLPGQVCYQGPVQFALPARAVADAALWLDQLEKVRSLVAGAVQTRLCTVQQLGAELRSGPVRGSALLRQALSEVSDGIRSAAEADLMGVIKRGNLPAPMFNARLCLGDELIAVTDAWWQDAGVAAEADSREWHLLPEYWEETMRRHARMTALGILVLHFSPRQLRQEPDQVLKAIRTALESRRGQAKLPIRTLPAIG